jgi:zinc D-Ala-D-Ala carboxypeptidase
MNISDIQQALVTLGWPISVDGVAGSATAQAVTDFQTGYAFEDLAVDGNPGPQTQAALGDAVNRGGMAAEHFSFKEFASKGDGWIKVHRDLVRGLERVRANLGGPLVILDGYRDPKHNAEVGGASNSQHVFGTAIDPSPYLPRQVVVGCGFSGIGISQKSDPGRVSHLDVRHVAPANPSGGTPANPTTFSDN